MLTKLRPSSSPLFRLRGLGALGQTASTNLSNGASVTMNFGLPASASLSGLVGGSYAQLQSAITSILQSWAPFANGVLVLTGVNVSVLMTSFSVSFVAGASPTVTSYTYGSISEGISETVGNALDVTVASTDSWATGINATSTWSQFEQGGGIDLNPLSDLNLQTDWNALKNLFTGGSGDGSNPPTSNPWKWVIIAGIAGLGIIVVTRVLQR